MKAKMKPIFRLHGRLFTKEFAGASAAQGRGRDTPTALAQKIALTVLVTRI